MRKRRITAILLSSILAMSSCMPMGGMTAFAAEEATAGGTEALAEAEEPDEAAGQEEKEAVAASYEESETSELTDTEEIVSDETSDDTEKGESTNSGEVYSGDAESAMQEEAAVDSQEGVKEDPVDAYEPSAEEDKTEKDTTSNVQRNVLEENVAEEEQNSAKRSIYSEYQNAEIIHIGETKNVAIQGWDDADYLRFEAEEQGYYRVFSLDNNDYDPVATLYDSDLNDVDSNDDDEDWNYSISFFSEEGEIWYIESRAADEYAYYSVCMEYLGKTDPDKYVVTLDANGGYFDNQTGKSTKQIEIDKAEIYYSSEDVIKTITPPERMTLVGWNKDKSASSGSKDLYVPDISLGDVYYAIWSESVTVTVDANGGFFNQDPAITSLSSAAAKNVYFPLYNYDDIVECDGRVLIGWDTNRYSTSPSIEKGLAAKPESDIVYYAIWVEERIVTLDPNGGRFTTYDNDEWDYFDLYDEFVSISVAKGASCDPSYNKVRREGYLFDDWYVKSTGKRYTNTKIYEDTELIAKWKKAYKVTFDPNGGSYGYSSYLPSDYKYWLNKGEKYVKEGSTTSPFSWDSDLPEYEGHELVGWSLEKGGSLVEVREVTINKDTTFYAVWREEGSTETYSVTFNLNGGTTNGKTEYRIEVEKNETIGWVSVPENEDDTLAFGYWYVLQEGKENRIDNIRDYKVTQDITVYAKWVDTVTVTIDAGDGYILTYGEGYSHTKSYIAAKGEPFSPPGNRSFLIDYGGGRYINYLFDGLYEDKDFTTEADLSSADNMTLYVKFKPYYVVTLHGNGGQFTGRYDITTYGESTDETIQLIYIPGFDSVQLIREKEIAMYMGSGLFAIEEPGSYLVNNDGTIFGGWYYDPECTEYAGYYQDISVYGDIDLYAGYDNTKQCTVTLDAGEGKLDQSTVSYDVYENGFISSAEKVEVPTPPEGKVFTGWYLDQACTAENRVADILNHVFTKDTPLYAGYAGQDDVVTVRLDPNGGTYYQYFDAQNVEVVKGQALENTDTPENSEPLVFTGWYRDKDCTELIPDINQFYPDDDCTLYAGWEKGVKVTVVYDEDDILTRYIQKNQFIDWESNSFVSESDKDDEKLIGYSLNKDLSGKIYTLKELKSLPITEDTTFYAVRNVPRKVTVRNYVDKQREHSSLHIYVADKKLGDYVYTAYPHAGAYDCDFIGTIRYASDIGNGLLFEGVYTDASMSETGRITDIDNYSLDRDVTLYVNWTQGFPIKLVANGGYFESRDLAVYRLDSSYLWDWLRKPADKAAVNNLYIAKGSFVDPDGSIQVYHEDGLELEGWYYDKSCTKLATKNLASFSATKAMVLYANWQEVCKHVWNEEYTIDKKATCTEEGSESIHCSVCGEIKEGSARAIEKLAHTYGEWETVKEATCTEAGSQKKTCAACGDEVTEETPAKGHLWNENYTIDKEATCAEEGSESIHCSVCGEIKEGSARVIEKLAHTYGEWETVKEATCTEAGSQKKTCAACGDEVTEETPAKGHTWNEEYTIDKEATCAEEGSESIHCSVCGEIKEGSARVIEKLAHTYGEWETVKEATCTEAGSQKKTCAACGDEVTEETPAKGHTWNEEYTVDIEPTNSEDGSKSIHCSVCDAVKEGSEVSIPRLAKEVDKLTITGIVSKTYTGKEITQEPVIKDGNKELVQNTDYKVSYQDNINAGTAKVIIEGIGSYTGSVTKTFMILPGKTTRGDMFNLANNVKVTWKEVPGAKYYKVYREGVTDKKETRTEPVIVTTSLVGWDKDPGLTNGHAYRYKIVASLTGKGDSSGDSTLSYSKLMYRLKTVVIRSVKNTAPGKVTVKYDKTTSGDSYVLQYCERQDMVGAKTKVVLGANNTSYVIGGLKKGKTYYISIRVRKKVNGIDYYTTFGVAKKIKITK